MPYADTFVVIVLRPIKKIQVFTTVYWHILHVVRVEELFVHGHLIDALLCEFEGGEENGVDDTGS
jgi:hypothetical protein